MRLVVATLATGLCSALAACGTSTPASHASSLPAKQDLSPAAAPATPQASLACRTTAAAELEDVGRRIYAQAVDGRNVQSSVRRLTHAPALLAAVAADDPRATRVALGPLLKHQVVRLEVFGTHRRLATVGTTAAFSPIRAELVAPGGRRVGHLLLAVTGDSSYIGITRRLTGAHVVFRHGTRAMKTSLRAAPPTLPVRGAVKIAGTTYEAATIRTRAFPSGRMAITLLEPPSPSSVCGTDPADTRLRTIGAVGRRLFTAEEGSSSVQRTLSYAAHDPAFRAAAASGNAVALRAAVVGFFRNHRFHIVRVRLVKAGKLVYDLGGPYVIAPASRDIRGPDGRPAGRFTLAVQDDTGYIKLMHRFTGAAVQLRTTAGPVPGSTLEPGPASVPAHGFVTYHGRRYAADSFTATAFPSGPLRISLLVPRS